MKRKILMILMSFVLVGCGKADVPSFDDANTTDVNGYHTYYNMDKLCAQLERVDKKYDMTDPQDMMNQWIMFLLEQWINMTNLKFMIMEKLNKV